MKSDKRLYLLPLLLVLLMAACSKTPRGVLNQDKMARLMADIYCGESLIEYNRNIYGDDSMKKVVKQSVLAAHGIDEAQFDSTMSWYGRNIEEYIKACDKAVEILEKRLAQVPDDPEGDNFIMVSGDTAQVWPLSPYYHIRPSSPVRFITFRLNPDENWEPGDEYTLSYKFYNTHSPINAMVAVDYKDGGTVYKHDKHEGEGKASFSLRLDSTRTATSVYGYIATRPGTSENIYLDSISLVRTRLTQRGYYGVRNQPRFDRGIDSLKNR